MDRLSEKEFLLLKNGSYAVFQQQIIYIYWQEVVQMGLLDNLLVDDNLRVYFNRAALDVGDGFVTSSLDIGGQFIA